jgi:hypothetical protein
MAELPLFAGFSLHERNFDGAHRYKAAVNQTWLNRSHATA